MNLFPSKVKAAVARFPLGSQEGLGDEAKVVVKYFFPSGRYTFYVTEGEFIENGDVRFFGYCVSAFGEDCDEWAYAVLSEFQSVRVRGLSMERDLWLPIATRTVGELTRTT